MCIDLYDILKLEDIHITYYHTKLHTQHFFLYSTCRIINSYTLFTPNLNRTPQKWQTNALMSNGCMTQNFVSGDKIVELHIYTENKNNDNGETILHYLSFVYWPYKIRRLRH